MVELTRTVRTPVGLGPERASPTVGGYAGAPALEGLSALHELDVTVRGSPGDTGYLIDIKEIDRCVRAAAAPVIREAFTAPSQESVRAIMSRLVGALQGALPVELAGLRWRQSAFDEVSMSPANTSIVTIRRRFEFAAAHRLHVDRLSDDENRALFGKCNNPNGHGHNYVVEPCVDVDQSAAFTFADLDRLTKEAIIDRFDHTHLNLDTEEFGPDGLNPSVENIARVCFEHLAPQVAACGARLASLTVWETDRTCATYAGSG